MYSSFPLNGKNYTGRRVRSERDAFLVAVLFQLGLRQIWVQPIYARVTNISSMIGTPHSLDLIDSWDDFRCFQ